MSLLGRTVNGMKILSMGDVSASMGLSGLGLSVLMLVGLMSIMMERIASVRKVMLEPKVSVGHAQLELYPMLIKLVAFVPILINSLLLQAMPAEFARPTLPLMLTSLTVFASPVTTKITVNVSLSAQEVRLSPMVKASACAPVERSTMATLVSYPFPALLDHPST